MTKKSIIIRIKSPPKSGNLNRTLRRERPQEGVLHLNVALQPCLERQPFDLMLPGEKGDKTTRKFSHQSREERDNQKRKVRS
jgi:hypothetical protein